MKKVGDIKKCGWLKELVHAGNEILTMLILFMIIVGIQFNSNLVCSQYAKTTFYLLKEHPEFLLKYNSSEGFIEHINIDVKNSTDQMLENARLYKIYNLD